MTPPQPIHVVGGGLAGSEAAWQIAQAACRSVLHEMRPGARHRGAQDRRPRRARLLQLLPLRRRRGQRRRPAASGDARAWARSSCATGDAHQVPAGGALAVDRDGFSAAVTAALEAHPLVTIARDEVAGLPPQDWYSVIVATGPLTSPALAEAIRALTGESELAFFDAIAPIVHRESIDMSVAWFQSRYDKAGPGGTGADYINCPLDRDAVRGLRRRAPRRREDRASRSGRRTPYFDGCLPIEVMAERGRETLRHGPMKPFGLTNPHQPGEKPYAVVQLRQDNALGTLFNMVGFQTKLKHGEQARIFRTIPGLEKAEFARLGGLHRNTYLNSPKLLDATLAPQGDAAPALRRADHRLRGLRRERRGRADGRPLRRRRAARRDDPPVAARRRRSARSSTTSPAGTSRRIDEGPRSFQPMNVNFGLFPPLERAPKAEDGKRLRGPAKALAKKRALTDRARADLARWLAAAELPLPRNRSRRWQAALRCALSRRSSSARTRRSPRPRLGRTLQRHLSTRPPLGPPMRRAAGHRHKDGRPGALQRAGAVMSRRRIASSGIDPASDTAHRATSRLLRKTPSAPSTMPEGQNRPAAPPARAPTACASAAGRPPSGTGRSRAAPSAAGSPARARRGRKAGATPGRIVARKRARAVEMVARDAAHLGRAPARGRVRRVPATMSSRRHAVPVEHAPSAGRPARAARATGRRGAGR